MTAEKKSRWLKPTILVTGGVMMADLAVYPAAEKLFTAFSGTSVGVLNFILTGPSLILILASVLCGILTQYLGKKELVVGSYLLFTVSSLACAFVNSPYVLAVMRACMGVAMGFIGTAMVGLIAELYEDEGERSSILGYYNGVMSGLGALFSFLAGYLAMKNWHHVFLVFLVMIPISLAVIVFLPRTKPEGQHQSETASGESLPFGRVLTLAGAALVINCMYAVVLTQVAVIVSELGVGDASTAGIMGSLGTIGSLVACVSFGFVYDKCKNKIPVIYTLVMAAGYLGLTYAGTVWTAGLMCTVLGAMYGMSFSYYLMEASVIVPPSKASLSISIVNAAVYLGIFLGPYVPMVYEAVLGKSSILEILPYITGTLVLCGVLSVFTAISRSRK